MTIIFLLLLITSKYMPVQPLNILGVFPYEGQSHFFIYEKYLQKLVEKGHNLTVISHFPRNEINAFYHDISLVENTVNQENYFPMERSFWSRLKVMEYVITSGINNCKNMLKNKSVQDLWKSRRKFDMVVMEHFNSDCGIGLAYKLGAPFIGLTATDIRPWQHITFGIPFDPLLLPSIQNDGLKATMETKILDCIFRYKYASARQIHQGILARHFDDIPLKTWNLEQLSRGMKFLLLYRHFVISGARLLPSNVIEVGGYHIPPTKSLSPDLQKFINESEHGVIYISFGSMLKETSLPKYKMDVILDTLAELPQRVIWKWSGDNFPGNRKKIYVSKWLPQNDLLAHPKVLAFFSHCGLLSTTEAAYHGVPMIVMPAFDEQAMNSVGVIESGLGVLVDLNNLTKDNLLDKFRIALQSEAKVKRFSAAYKHRPVKAMDNAVFWTEFAAYHDLAISNHVADMSTYHYYCLDVLAFFGISLLICILLVAKLTFVLLSVTRKRRNLKKFKTKED